MDLPITTTLAGESLPFYGDIKCITPNGQMILYVAINYEYHVTMIHFVQKILGRTKSFSIYAYGFVRCHTCRIGVTVCLHGFTVIM